MEDGEEQGVGCESTGRAKYIVDGFSAPTQGVADDVNQLVANGEGVTAQDSTNILGN